MMNRLTGHLACFCAAAFLLVATSASAQKVSSGASDGY